jgi:clan AA aspartic protease (TIGR02281 family)
MRKMLQLSVAVLFSTSACAGTIYKCRNAEGVLLYQEKPCEKEAQAISSWASTSGLDADPSSSENKALVIGQGNGGHYFVDGAVNDNYLNFIIDTGATVVSLPLAMAASAGVQCQKQALMRTGNGVTQGCTATVKKLQFGHFTLRYVEAVVLPNLNQPLLGMNVLRQFRVEQDNGQMRLSKKY